MSARDPVGAGTTVVHKWFTFPPPTLHAAGPTLGSTEGARRPTERSITRWNTHM